VSQRLAEFLWRWRFPLSTIVVIVAIAFAPRANITHIDNDISAWFGKDDPVYRDYERFRDEFGGSRTLIHFINRYRREVAAGATTDEAIETATVHEGRASLTTAVINSLGFGVLLLSEYKPTAWFGGLLGLTMAVAFLAEVFILPATIKLLPRMFGADALRRTRRKLAAA